MSNQKIILIEDEVFIHDLYKKMLEKVGYVVKGAFDGEEGLKLIQENMDAALVLLDVMLPKMNGIEVLRQVKRDEKTKGVQVVLLSNLGDESIIQEAVNLGARDYLKKVNITPRDLVNHIERYLSDPSFVIGINAPQY
jgi:DNA-binding response OmpR family regulator